MTSSFKHSSLITLKDDKWFERQKIAGKCVGSILSAINKIICEKLSNLTLLDLEEIAIKKFEEFGCSATFYNYKGFPGQVCLSVNRALVHGVPSKYKLQEGDIVKFDLGATYEGAIADAASTTIYGKPKSFQHMELVKSCKESLNNAIKAVAIDKRMGCIGSAIHHTVKKTRFGLVTKYGGHGLEYNTPHSEPFVPNKSQPNEGLRIQEGMTFCIEPMLTIGDNRTTLASDGWTVMTSDIGVHEEHTIFVGSDKIHVMTEWE